MAFKNIVLFLTLFFFVMSCVENRIFIQMHPNMQTYFKFESRGDSLDIFNDDFIHPRNLPGLQSSKLLLVDQDEKNWSIKTEGVFQDTAIIFHPTDSEPLGYSYKQSITHSWFSKEYNFNLKFNGRYTKNEYPKLYNAILSEKHDSLYWLPEAIIIIMKKGLDDLDEEENSGNQDLWNRRLVNHLKSSLKRTTTVEDLQHIQNNREIFLTDLLNPFSLEPSFISRLAKKMEKHEKILKATIDLNDDSFLIKAVLPGQTIYTNATSINHDTLIWDFGLDSLLSDTYQLDAVSILYTTDQLENYLIYVGIVLVSLLTIWLRTRP
jgi:hypothetical protein